MYFFRQTFKSIEHQIHNAWVSKIRVFIVIILNINSFNDCQRILFTFSYTNSEKILEVY